MVDVEELGERKIIEVIRNQLDPMPDMPISFGDDVSGVNIRPGEVAVLKSDMLVGKTDVPPEMSLWHAARKAVVMNISDLAAKGVRPIALLASVGFPKEFKEKDIEQVGKGLNSGAREYGSYIIGGDTNEASDLIINCSVFGIGQKGQLMLRNGARPEDIVAVTGSFGNPPAGLKILIEHLSEPPHMRKPLVDSVLMPHARLNEGLALAQTGAVTASIDSSDGLAWSLHEIARASKVGIVIDNLPVAAQAERFARRHNLDPVELALYGGEEYELIVTVKPDLWKEVEKAMSILRIGLATKDRRLVLETRQGTIPIGPRGWEHFKTA